MKNYSDGLEFLIKIRVCIACPFILSREIYNVFRQELKEQLY